MAICGDGNGPRIVDDVGYPLICLVLAATAAIPQVAYPFVVAIVETLLCTTYGDGAVTSNGASGGVVLLTTAGGSGAGTGRSGGDHRFIHFDQLAEAVGPRLMLFSYFVDGEHRIAIAAS